jgi:hypothetical protein
MVLINGESCAFSSGNIKNMEELARLEREAVANIVADNKGITR